MMKKNKLLNFTLWYLIFYIIAFFVLESREVSINIVHTWLDDIIPFCEYFIIPYFIWFLYLAGTGIYFLFYCQNQEESKQFIYGICTGMTIFLIVSFLYPNGHDLRPELTGDSLFIMGVKLLHQIDTPTNILPSMHVYGTVACSVALLRQTIVKERKWMVGGIWLISILIVLSTVFLKQHSVIDVFTALILNFTVYQLFYKWNLKQKRGMYFVEEKNIYNS